MYEFGQEEVDAAVGVMSSKLMFRYMPGAVQSASFEAELAANMGSSHALATSSGTAALICGLAALGVGPEDEVLVPAYGYVADLVAVLAVGATPVVCEIDERLGIDPEDAEAKVTNRTRAIMPVHMNGFSSNLEAVQRLAERRALAVIEDACQAIGGSYKGRRLGTWGDIGAYSFNYAKTITAGEGGALVTNDRSLYDRAFIMHDCSCVYDGYRLASPNFSGLAFRMNEISAAILRVQLGRLSAILDELRRTRGLLASVLREAGIRELVPHDIVGNCGTHVGCVFDDPRVATEFAGLVNARCPAFTAFQGTSMGHSVFEWELLHAGRGGHHPLRNPLSNPARCPKPEDFPRTREILDGAVLVRFDLRTSEEAVRQLGAAAYDFLRATHR